MNLTADDVIKTAVALHIAIRLESVHEVLQGCKNDRASVSAAMESFFIALHSWKDFLQQNGKESLVYECFSTARENAL